MLRSLPCERMVAAISYGCIGRSRSADNTASARGLDTLRRWPAMLTAYFLVTVYP